MTEPDRAFLGVGWAFPVRLGADGEIATAAYEEDIRQAVRIILGTRPGERLMRPELGAGLADLAFEPISTTTLALARRQVTEALVRWEPRIDQIEVTVAPDRAAGRLDITIHYRVRATNTFYNLVYPFHLTEGRDER